MKEWQPNTTNKLTQDIESGDVTHHGRRILLKLHPHWLTSDTLWKVLAIPDDGENSIHCDSVLK